METDDVAVITVGTVLWAVTLVVLLVLRDRLADEGHEDWVWVAAAGFGLGLIGIRYVRRRRAALHGNTDPSRAGSAPNQA